MEAKRCIYVDDDKRADKVVFQIIQNIPHIIPFLAAGLSPLTT